MELHRTSEGSPAPYPRAPLRVPVRYRLEGEADWYGGTTENVSRSGALLRVERPLLISARIQLVLCLPARMLDTAPCELVSVGTVCRRGQSPVGEDVIGVRFDEVADEALGTAIARVEGR